jgi:hypothetical protein
MNRNDVLRMINDRIDSDTGAGGLRPVSNPLITGFYWDQFPPSGLSAYPYIVGTVASDVEEGSFTRDGYTLDIYFNIYVLKAAQSPGAANTIAARLRTRLHRWRGTMPGGSTDLATTMQRVSGNNADDLNVVQRIETYTLSVYQA